MRIGVAVAAIIAAAGCKSWTHPDEAYRAFARALADRDGAKALALLSESSQRAMARQAEEASKASGGTLPADARRMLVAGPGEAPEIKSIAIVSRTDAAATLAVDDGRGAREVRMVKEGLRWKVDLTGT